MTHQVKITLADGEYNIFLAEAEKAHEGLEVFLHKLITEQFHILLLSRRRLGGDPDIRQYLARKGIIYRHPTDQPTTPEEEAEDKRLADLFGQVGADGKTVSDMVIEDRGPRE